MSRSDPPAPITERIRIALIELRHSRDNDDPAREFAWASMLDRLLDTHTALLKGAGKFRPLEDIDPDLAERLMDPQGVKYVKRRR